MADRSTLCREVVFTPLPILVACPVRVTPDGRCVTDDGEPLPLSERTEHCAVWAHWMIGGQVCCDVHAAIGCDFMGVDFDGLVREAGREVEDARRPWSARRRSTQEDAIRIEQSMQRTGNVSGRRDV